MVIISLFVAKGGCLFGMLIEAWEFGIPKFCKKGEGKTFALKRVCFLKV